MNWGDGVMGEWGSGGDGVMGEWGGGEEGEKS